MKELIDIALRLGATAARIIPSHRIVVKDELAGHCVKPRCENYGTSAGCPPHVSGPDGFREILKDFSKALVFKIEVPSRALLSSRRFEVFTLLHEAAAGIEREAQKMGHSNSRAFVSGGCKKLFCSDHPNCTVLDGEPCRHPDRARPSMSGYGVDVTRLMEAAGWTMAWIDPEDGSDDDSLAPVVGMVLIG